MKNVIRCLALIAAIVVVAGSAYADQSYRITLSSASKIGSTDLKPGEYKLVVDGAKVRFTELNSGKMVEVEAKVQEVDTKTDHTAIHSTHVDGVDKISEIRIGGSKTRIAFN